MKNEIEEIIKKMTDDDLFDLFETIKNRIQNFEKEKQHEENDIIYTKTHCYNCNEYVTNRERRRRCDKCGTSNPTGK